MVINVEILFVTEKHQTPGGLGRRTKHEAPRGVPDLTVRDLTAPNFTMTSGLSGKVDSTLTNPPPTVRNYDQKKTKIYSNTAYVVKFVLKI